MGNNGRWWINEFLRRKRKESNLFLNDAFRDAVRTPANMWDGEVCNNKFAFGVDAITEEL